MSSVLTVSQINTYLKAVLDGDDNLQHIFVCGEISNFTNHYRTGHFYFTLKDEKAAIKAVMFRTAAQRLRFLPENGMRVIIRGSISLFERDGVYQLYCDDMQPDGAGDLSVAFEQRKKKLEEMGLFDPLHKKPIPVLPSRIGVITSPTGAAVHDILNVLERRFPFAAIVFCGVQVQGESAAPQIAEAIARFNELQAADVLIVGRGGGSIEDLWAFNEEIVAHAIYNSHIPVISAVGHETDFTIADFVADLRAPTPSAAAELASPDTRELLFQLDTMLDRLTERVLDKHQNKALRLEAMLHRLQQQSPQMRLSLLETKLQQQTEKLISGGQAMLRPYADALGTLAQKLEMTSPLRTLARGYVLAQDENGLLVRNAAKVQKGQTLALRFADGSVLCRAEEVTLPEGKDA